MEEIYSEENRQLVDELLIEDEISAKMEEEKSNKFWKLCLENEPKETQNTANFTAFFEEIKDQRDTFYNTIFKKKERKFNLSSFKKLKKKIKKNSLDFDMSPKNLKFKTIRYRKKENGFDSILNSSTRKNQKKIIISSQPKINTKTQTPIEKKLRFPDSAKKRKSIRKFKSSRNFANDEETKHKILPQKINSSRIPKIKEEKEPKKFKKLPKLGKLNHYVNFVLGVEIPDCVITNFSKPITWSEIAKNEERRKIFKNSKNTRKNIFEENFKCKKLKGNRDKNFGMNTVDFRFTRGSESKIPLNKQLLKNRSVEKSLRDDILMFYKMKKNVKNELRRGIVE